MRLIFLIIFLLICAGAYALPPLGLTQISADPNSSAGLAIHNGTAYLSHAGKIWTVDPNGPRYLTAPINDSFGSDAGVTRVIADDAGELFFGAVFSEGGTTGEQGSAIYRLDSPNDSVAQWDRIRIVGFDKHLRGIGTLSDPLYGSARLFPDGTSEIISAPWALPSSISSSGVVLGTATVGVSGAGPALLNDDNSVLLLGTNGIAGTVRDREDGDGTNVGYSFSYHNVIYGDGNIVAIDGTLPPGGLGTTFVSETDLVVIDSFINEPERLYYPGINPAGIDRSVPLADFFPALQQIDFRDVAGITSSQGRIYMLLSGRDGLWLFVAPDPSVVPEPHAVLALLICLPIFMPNTRTRPQAA